MGNFFRSNYFLNKFFNNTYVIVHSGFLLFSPNSKLWKGSYISQSSGISWKGMETRPDYAMCFSAPIALHK